MIATLGDPDNPLTCSYDAAKRYLLEKNIQLHSSFEQAAVAVKQGEAELLMVPAAYPKINPFVMDRELVVCDTFIHQIPALVLAAPQQRSEVDQAEILFYHPATEVLIKEITYTSFKEKRTVASNSEACQSVVDSVNTHYSLALTNELCAVGYGLWV